MKYTHVSDDTLLNNFTTLDFLIILKLDCSMNVPSFVGPLGSILLFALTVLGFCFYHCYWKPKRRRRQNAESRKVDTEPSRAISRSKQAKWTSKNEEDCCYDFRSDLSSYSAGYCFQGGYPFTSGCSEQRWHPVKMKYQKPCEKFSLTESGAKADCCELRVDVVNDRPTAKPCKIISRQLSTDSRGSRQVCHLQVIQECEEEKAEDGECCKVDVKDFQT